MRVIDDQTISVSLDETTQLEDVAQLIEIFARIKKVTLNKESLFQPSSYKIAPLLGDLSRKSQFMTQQIFNSIHSETQMLRFIRNISKKDISLAKSMIPLGSCTMKLNASSEMVIIIIIIMYIYYLLISNLIFIIILYIPYLISS